MDTCSAVYTLVASSLLASIFSLLRFYFEHNPTFITPSAILYCNSNGHELLQINIMMIMVVIIIQRLS